MPNQNRLEQSRINLIGTAWHVGFAAHLIPMKIKLLILALIVGILSLLGACSKKATQPPNFIIIFIDDLGYADIGPFGSKLNRTPNLDRMATEGMKLTNFYVPASVCTPSRAALMTGCYPQRVDMEHNALPGSGNDLVLFPGDPKGLNPDEITIAEMLKEQGYATTIIGKWHLGDQKQWLPTTHGFDSYFGIPYSNDMGVGNTRRNYPPLPVVLEKDVIEEEPDQAYLTKRYTERALKFIEDKKDKPFFLYLPHTMVHLPRFASPAFLGKSNNGLYGDIVEELDWSVGQILDKLVELGLDKSTVVLFFSDNGGTRSTDTYTVSNLPLRGGKGSMWEGGFRVCSLAWAPGLIPAGSVSSEITTSMDLYPTFANLSGGNIPTDRILDGKDIAPILRGDANAKSPHEAFFYRRASIFYAVRSGPWKLFVKDYPFGGSTIKAGTLYNLEQDIGETTDVSSNHPEVVSRLNELAEASRIDLGDTRDKPGANVRKAAYIDLKDAVTLTQRK
jgi:arylsulfatase A-like enzyme